MQATQQLIGQSPAFHALMDAVSDAAALEKPILITGERGTGKELIASRMHFLSPRWEQAYVHVNCAAYSDALLDAALFGQTFTGGKPDIDGQFIRADGGTLFLDNIETVSLRLQEKLLQAFEYGIIDPLGTPDTQDINVRIIAATSADLPKAVSTGRFRADLLDHITFDVLPLPPLRARLADIIPLAEYFGRRTALDLGAESFPGFTPEALIALETHNWTGNIRELKTVVARSTGKAFLRNEALNLPIAQLVIDPFASPYRLSDNQPLSEKPSEHNAHTLEIQDTHTPPAAPPSPSKGFSDRVYAFERSLIDEALRAGDNHQGKAAKHLDLSYHQFRGLLRKHGLKK